MSDPPEQCSNRILDKLAADDTNTPALPPVLTAPLERARFPASQSLGTEQVAVLTRRSYCRVIGILGPPNSGKTAAIVSLFLLLARNKLSGFTFADSRTLMALNEISQGARRWIDGDPPDQMTSHTELADERDAGFLHLKLRRRADGETFDFLLPDLPGEWSDTLIDKNRVDRLDLLKSADALWLMADGRKISGLTSRRTALRRIELLIGRAIDLIERSIPMFLVLTHRDSGTPSPADVDGLRNYAKAKGVDLHVIPIASFKKKGGVLEPGFGINELIEQAIGAEPFAAVAWPDVDQKQEHRAMLRFAPTEKAQ